MRLRLRQHSGDEFGRPGLGSATAIGDRGLGSASGVVVDGIVEREAGTTPGPFVSSRTIAIVLGAAALVSAVIMVTFAIMAQPAPLPSGIHRSVWVGAAASDAKLVFLSEPDENDEVTEWTARAAEQAAYLIDGRSVSFSEFAAELEEGMWPADVTASTDGVFTRVEIITPVTTGPE